MYEYWNYRYITTDQAEDIGENHFEKVSTVEQVDYENAIGKRYSIEKYAKGTGLVYKNMMILNTQKICSSNGLEDTAMSVSTSDGKGRGHFIRRAWSFSGFSPWIEILAHIPICSLGLY